MNRAARMQPNPFREGIDAFGRKRLEENPHPFGTQAHNEWRDGWRTAAKAAEGRKDAHLGAVEK